MATVDSVVSQLIRSLHNTHISSDKLIFKVEDPDQYTLEEEKGCEEVLHLLRDNKSLWKIGDDWSDEAVQLRELLATCAVKKFNNEFFFSFIKTLRIVDKQITAVDNTIAKFPYLEDLVLSCNYLSDVAPELLPPGLLLLELNGNCISFKDERGRALANGLPRLKHLGLGRNSINDVSWFYPKLWSNLASLDLSRNNLSDFKEIIDKVTCLPCLKSLVLVGNPLALTAAYRTAIVHRLGHLHSLDDVPISADETLNAPPIVAACKLDDLCVQAQIHFRITSTIVGLPQPPINEVTQLPADWFFRLEIIVPTSVFDAKADGQLPSTIFNQPVSDAPTDAAAAPNLTKGEKKQAASERLNPCIERDYSTSTVKICSPALKYHPTMTISTLFQPIINTTALEQLRDVLEASSLRIAVVLLVRTIVTPENSRPPSTNKKDKEKQGKDHDKQAKEKEGKGRRVTQGTIEGITTILDRFVLAESALSTGSIVFGSTSTVSMKINTPSSNVAAVIDQMERSRPPSVAKGKPKRGKSPKSPRGKSPKSPRGDRKSPHGDRKSPHGEKTPPPGAKGAKAGAAAAPGDVPAPPPPPDLQVSFGFDLIRIRSVQDVQKWNSVIANTASVMAMPEK